MRELTLEQVRERYPYLAKEMTSLTSINAALRMMKNTPSREDYFKALTILAAQLSGIYSSFEKKFEVYYEVNPETREVKTVDINTNGFISERSIKKTRGMIYLKMFYSSTPEMALEEFDRLNSK